MLLREQFLYALVASRDSVLREYVCMYFVRARIVTTSGNDHLIRRLTLPPRTSMLTGIEFAAVNALLDNIRVHPC